MLEAGRILQERYQLQRQLGRTAAGRQTWLATDLQPESPEPVVVKLLAFSPQMQWEELKLFEREAQVLKNLDHPRIPRYRDYFSLDRHQGEGLPWFALVQDYIPGSSLQESLDQGRKFSEAEVRQIAIEVLQILIHLHELSPPVLHRDLKPSNLILSGEQQVYLVDFGAVQDQVAVTGMTFTVVGTSGYAPLEQFWGRAVPASDLYALGATLIHLLTGVAPAELLQADLRIRFADRISLKPIFAKWLEKMTALTLDQRFTTARQALDSLKQEIVKAELSQPTSTSLSKLSKVPIVPPPKTRIIVQKTPAVLMIQKPVLSLFQMIPQIITMFAIALLGFAFTSFNPISLSFWLVIMPIAFAVILPALRKSWAGEISFYANHDRFEVRKRFPNSIQPPGHQGAISNIRYIFPTEINKGEQNSRWTITIQAGEHDSYSIDWGLTHHECLWLIHEIKDWLEI